MAYIVADAVEQGPGQRVGIRDAAASEVRLACEFRLSTERLSLR